MKKHLAKPEIIFIIYALLFGMILLWKVLPSSILDGGEHYKRAMEISQGVFISKNIYSWVCSYSPIMYLASGLGLKLFGIFQVGRLFNLLLWTILIATAIRITPLHKWLFLVVALLPTSIFQGMSYSADSFSNAFSFLFFAYMFKIIFNKDKLSSKNISALTVFTSIGALCKGAISPLFLLLLAKYNKCKKIILLSLLVTLATGILLWWSSVSQGVIPDFVNQELNKQFIIEHPFKYILIVLHTVKISLIPWIFGCIGQIGWNTIGNSLILLTLILYIGAIFFIPSGVDIKPKHRIIALITLIGYTFFTCTLLFFIYTPYGSDHIDGVQSRYFLQVTPLLFLIFGHNKSYKISKSYIRILIIYIFLVLCYTCYIAI